jgi:aminoglycoside 6'-N-acetyltransferase
MIYFKPVHENDRSFLYGWFQEPTINKLYARGQKWSLKDIEDKYLPKIKGYDV